MAKFSDVLTIVNGKNQKKVENPNGQYPIYGSGGIMGFADSYICEPQTIVIGRKGSINKPIFVETPFWNVDTAFGLCADKSKLEPKYLYYFCEKFNFEQLSTTVTIPSLTKANLLNIEIKIPPLDEQRKIAAVLDRVNDLIAKRREQLDKLDLLVKSKFVEMFGDPIANNYHWNKQPLKKLCNLITGNTPSRKIKEYYGSYIEWIKSDNISLDSLYLTQAREYLSELGADVGRVVEPGAILMTCIAGSLNTVGNIAIADRNVAFNQQITAFDPVDVETMYLYHLLRLIKPQIHEFANTALKCIINKGMLEQIEVIVPDQALQARFSNIAKQADKSKSTIQQSLEKLEILKKSLMQQYFG